MSLGPRQTTIKAFLKLKQFSLKIHRCRPSSRLTSTLREKYPVKFMPPVAVSESPKSGQRCFAGWKERCESNYERGSQRNLLARQFAENTRARLNTRRKSCLLACELRSELWVESVAPWRINSAHFAPNRAFITAATPLGDLLPLLYLACQGRFDGA